MAHEFISKGFRKFWNRSEIRVSVLVSLVLQIILVLLGKKRKYSTKTWIRFILWMSYLLADWVATLSIGVLSNLQGNESDDDISTSRNYTVTSFWAPFLLLHLGGPDTITAYSLEDNELWWRNFITLGGQLGAVLYIFLNAWSNNILNFLSIPILIAGFIKFGERIWALRRASSECFRKSMFPSPEAGPSYARHMDEYWSKTEEGFKVCFEKTQEVPTIGHTHHHHLRSIIRPNSIVPYAHNLQHAHKFFVMFKPLFADLILSIHDIVHSKSFFQETSCDEVFRVIEIELGFMYDLFYTKALKFNL